jgi:hypothetical protein
VVQSRLQIDKTVVLITVVGGLVVRGEDWLCSVHVVSVVALVTISHQLLLLLLLLDGHRGTGIIYPLCGGAVLDRRAASEVIRFAARVAVLVL